jgi:hypothetical protein
MDKNLLFKWVDGREGTGYQILTLVRTSILPFDCYIIRYPTGSYMPPHRDKVKGKKHYRLNLILRRARGGEFVVKNAIFRSSRLNIFRPDLETHSVTKVESGTRYVFSIGLGVKSKP